MVRRLAIGGALACSIAALVASVPAEATAKGLLRGRTAQKRMVKLKVRGTTLQIIRFDIELSCRDGGVLIDEESGFMPTPLRRNGAFSEVQTGSTDTVMIRGRVQGRAIRGRLRVKDRLGKSRCDSRWVLFTAQP